MQGVQQDALPRILLNNKSCRLSAWDGQEDRRVVGV